MQILNALIRMREMKKEKKFAILTCEQDVNISQILAFISRDVNLIKCWSIIVQLLKFIR